MVARKRVLEAVDEADLAVLVDDSRVVAALPGLDGDARLRALRECTSFQRDGDIAIFQSVPRFPPTYDAIVFDVEVAAPAFVEAVFCDLFETRDAVHVLFRTLSRTGGTRFGAWLGGYNIRPPQRFTWQLDRENWTASRMVA